MYRDMPSFSYVTLYILSINIVHKTATERSSHWKLNDGKVSALASAEPASDDPLFSMLTNKMDMSNGEWSVTDPQSNTCTNSCKTSSNENLPLSFKKMDSQIANNVQKQKKSQKNEDAKRSKSNKTKHLLDCGDVVLATGVDHLSGVLNRHKHPKFAEPEVAVVFGRPGINIDTSDMEKTLYEAMREHPTSPHVYNHIGNFWRIRGNTRFAIQCFRKALSLSPNNSDVLLNLGRVLMNLKYEDDALTLTKQSLQLLSPGQNSWLQHFTLGEILKSRSIREAAVHFKLALEQNPGFAAAQAYLEDIEGNLLSALPMSLSHIITVLIASCIVFFFCFYLVKWLDNTLSEFRSCEFHYQRSFNRAMAMRSLKVGHKYSRAVRKQQNS